MATYNFFPDKEVLLEGDVQEVFAGGGAAGQPGKVNIIVSSQVARDILEPHVGKRILGAEATPDGRINLSGSLKYVHGDNPAFVLSEVTLKEKKLLLDS